MSSVAVGAGRRATSVKARKWAVNGVLIAFVLALAYLTLLPLIRLQVLAFEHDGAAYRKVYSRPEIWHTIWTTVELALGSVAIAVVLGTAMAWAATLLSPRLRILRILPILPIVVPAVASVLGWSFLFSPGPGYLNALLRHLPWWSDQFEGPVDIYTVQWIVIITGIALAAFIYLFVSAGFESINAELIEAAQVSGSSKTWVFFHVTLPLLRPSLVYGTGVALLLGLGQFTGPLILGSNKNITVLTTDMFRATQLVPPQYDVAAAYGSPLLVFGIIVILLNKILLGEQSRFVTHGGKAFRQLEKSSKTAAIVLVFYGIAATFLPIFGLVVVGLSPYWSGTIDVHSFTLDNFHTIFADSKVIEAIKTSLITSLIAVAIMLPLGYIIASLLRKRHEHRAAGPALDLLVAIPLSIPAVIFGVGFLLTYTNKPFVLYGTMWVMILVYMTLMLPFVTRMQLSGMIALGDSYREASRVCGAGWLRTNLTVIAPLMRATFGGAAALMFILLANEFAASLLVRATNVQVMGTVLYDYYGSGLYPQVACVALIMIGVTAAGVFVAILISGSDVFSKL